MQNPLVSVKMLTYNHSLYITQAIEGVLTQKTNFPFELVIGEDCSTDDTREIVCDYAKRHPEIIRLIISDENVGAKMNSLRTMEACRGKYLAFCEGDDYWHREDKLQLQVDYLEEHPECGLVYSDLDWFYVERDHRVQNHLKSSGKDTVCSPGIIDILTKKVDIRTCTVVIRKKYSDQIIEADPFLHGGHFKMGDTQLWAELSLLAKIYCIDESLATYRILTESATQSKSSSKRLRFWISDNEMYLYLCTKHNLPQPLRVMYYNNMRRAMFQLAFYEQQAELAESTRQKYTHLSPKDWIWYLGAKYPAIRKYILAIKKLQRWQNC